MRSLTLVWLSSFLACLSWSLVRGEELFSPRVSTVGSESRGIATADLDRDGWLDLVTTGEFSPFVSVLFGAGDGRFLPEVRLPTILRANDVVVVDLNDDNKDDLAVTGTEGVSVFLGAGNRTFAPEVFYEAVGGGFAIATADFNDDGHPDLVQGGDWAWILLGHGDGTLEPRIIEQAPNGPSFFVVTGDFNDDGMTDFAGSGFADDNVWLGQGDGSFLPRIPISLGLATGGVTHDFDGDGHVDLAVATNSTVRVLLGTGDGQFTNLASYDFSADYVALADLNRDGDQDLVASDTSLTGLEAAVLISNGDGTFATPMTYPTPVTGGATTTGDFDRDGNTDVAIVSLWESSGFVLPSKSTVVPRAGVAFTLSGDGQGGLIGGDIRSFGVTMENPEAVAVGDFNDDGHQDLAVANSGASDVSIALGQGDGSFVEQQPVNAGTAPISLAVGYLNNDAVQDLAVANSGSSDVSILVGDANGGFVAGVAVALEHSPSWIVRSDFDGNGISDLATANPEGDEVSILRGLGDGTFKLPVSVPVGEEPVSLDVADVDAQNGIDLVVANRASGDISILLGSGTGTFEPERRIPSGTSSLRAIAARDINDDEDVDLVVVGSGDPPVVVLYGDGQGGFSESQPLDVRAAVNDVIVADLDGNGREDIIVAHIVPAVAVLLGVDGGFAPRLEFAAGDRGSLSVGEFNDDGRLDLAAANLNDRMMILLNQAPVSIKFAEDKSTLSWPQLVGYDSYNIYRGSIAELNDVNHSLGYGTCRNDSDPNLTDTVFVDEETPQLPGDGFFYLMGRVRNGQESDLGSASNGSQRVPSVACGSSARGFIEASTIRQRWTQE